jgi:prephenate dehydratase
MRAGYLGPEGTFTHEALLAFPLATDFTPTPLPTVHDAVRAVAEGEVDRALVPIENALEGAVGATLDALAEQAVAIVGEVVSSITHCLIAHPLDTIEATERVVSHPQAIAQCARFLRDVLPDAEVVAAASTAEAVRTAAITPGTAAIGTHAAAELYGCTILREAIEDEPGNATRFVWLARFALDEPSGDVPHKTSVVWWGAGDEAPGWLVRCLTEFASRDVNLTRIESRPRKLGLGHYLFFADVDGHTADPRVGAAIDGLRAHAEVVRVLGSYAVTEGSNRAQ